MARQDIRRVLRVWGSRHYYELSRKGSLDTGHFGMRMLKKLAKNSKNILDLGCGEGTRLNYLTAGKTRGVGVDISETAIRLAKEKYPKLKFIKADLEKLPLKDEIFDLTYFAFVLEHLISPEKAIIEAIRVTKKGGYLVLIAPNFGAPARASPVFRGSRVKKFLKGILLDLALPVLKVDTLQWSRVQPIEDLTKYKPDFDAVCEPYIGTLIKFLKGKGVIIKIASTCWQEELPNAKFIQKIFRFFGERNIYPFKLWGPHLTLVAQRRFG